MEKKSNILNQVEDSINVGEFKRGVNNILETFHDVATMHKTLFSEMKKQGYSDNQAFDFTNQYMLKLMFNGAGENIK